MKNDYQDRSVAVLGFGRSGRAATDFLLQKGAKVTVYTESEPDPAQASKAAANGAAFRVGRFPEVFLQELLVRSPILRPDLPPIVASLRRGAVLTSETELFFAHSKARIIGVTGSDGKTTTSNLIALLLRGAGHSVYLGGNNGTPLLPVAERMRSTDFAVVELSSFQLMTLRKSPLIGVITNITPNHLNWHRDMGEYITAKRKIAGDGMRFLAYNSDCPTTAQAIRQLSVPTVAFAVRGENMMLTEGGKTDTVLAPKRFSLPGRHNLENLAAAYAAARPFVTLDDMDRAVADFHGVPHRLQYVDTVGGVRFYNSSIDTTPTRTAAALAALGGRPIVIAGGRGKGVSFAPLAEVMASRASAVCLYGEAAEEMAAAMGAHVVTHRFQAFEAAFYAAAKMANRGETVLLSPACTAFDQFRDFEHRGRVFCDLVRQLKKETMPS